MARIRYLAFVSDDPSALAGFYHLVSFTANAARVEREDAAARFPVAQITG